MVFFIIHFLDEDSSEWFNFLWASYHALFCNYILFPKSKKDCMTIDIVFETNGIY